MLDLVGGGSDRGRVALEWRAAVLVAVLACFPGVGDDLWLLLGLAAAAVLVGLGLTVNAGLRPVTPSATPSRCRSHE